jgi:universal stress protein F
MGIVLVGLDGSERAAGVLKEAVDLAQRTGRKVVLLRSFGLPREMPPAVWKLDEASLIESLRKHASEYLEECGRTLPPDLLVEARVEIGAPWRTVCATAKALHADLIVIGSHGYGTLDRLLGTTAGKIVNHAECSVLVVRESPPADRSQ